MTHEQYLDAHPAEVFAKIAKAMGYGWPDRVNFITNAEQRWELAVFLFNSVEKEWSTLDDTDVAMDHESALLDAMASDNPPRELVLVAMDMFGINKGEE